MIAVIQRVSHAEVVADGILTGKIGKGLYILLGVEKGDSQSDAIALAEKITKLRIFSDENGKMNRSLLDINGEILIVSQFTLCGDCKKGTRPSFDKSALPEIAKDLYEKFILEVKNYNLRVETGVFAAMMDVALINDGPVTFMIEL